jgi:hypothetical protein
MSVFKGIVGGCVIRIFPPELSEGRKLVARGSAVCKKEVRLKYILTIVDSTGAALTRAFNQLFGTTETATTVTTPVVVCTAGETYMTKFEITDSSGEVLQLQSDSVECPS